MCLRRVLIITFFLLLPCLFFSQQDKEKTYLRLTAGNDFFLLASTQTSLLTPHIDALFVATNREDSVGAEVFFVSGFSFARSQQDFQVIWPGSNTNNVKDCIFYTNEFLFSVGGSLKYPLAKRIFLSLSFILQGGQNHTWTDDPNGSMLMGRIIYNGAGLAGFMRQPSGPNYTMKYRTAKYKWSYLQFYSAPELNLLFRVSKGAFFYIGLQSRIFLFREYIGNDPGNVKFNYAPFKMNLQVGVQLKIFK